MRSSWLAPPGTIRPLAAAVCPAWPRPAGWVCALLAALTLNAVPLHPQQAVVLGAGGARGLAHAGVLVGLEEKGYDPDLVLGSSMGAIVGAHYAAGYSAEAIWRLAAELDWTGLFTPAPLFTGPDRALQYPIGRVDIGAIRAERVRGVVSEWRINRLLVRHLFDAGVRAGNDFDRLPRRFRSVTTDLETGELFVLGTGDLPRAVRASMGVPGIFSAIRWQGRHLADGGVRNYLPIGVARELGARYVIASDVIRPPEPVEEFSPLEAGWRAFRLILRHTLDPDEQADVLLVPRLAPGLSAATFPADATPLLEAGRAAAREAPPADGGVRRHVPAPATPREAPPSWTGTAVPETTDPTLRAIVEAAFRDVAPGPYDPGAVLRAVDRVYATGLAEGVWPRAVPVLGRVADENADAARDGPAPARLVVLVDPRPAAMLVGAAAYENDRGGRGWAGVHQRFGERRPYELGLTVLADGIDQRITGTVRAYSLRLVPFVWSGGGHFQRANERVFDDEGRRIGTARIERAGGWLGAEVQGVSPAWFLTANIVAESVNERDGRRGSAVGPRLRLGRVTPLNPVVGGPTELEAEVRRGSVAYWRAGVRASFRGRLGPLLAAWTGDAVAATRDAPIDVLPALGQDHAVPALRWGEARGPIRAVTGMDLALPAVAESHLRLRLRAGAVGDALSDLEDGDAWIGGAQLGLIWGTPAGPVLAAIAVNTEGARRLELRLGPVF